jgi:putative flavoprotein involved in K+ transport
MPAWPGDGNPSAAHVVDDLKAYEARYDLPLYRPETAASVRAATDGSFTTITDRRRWTGRAVISATGTWENLYRPDLPGAGDFSGEQLHTTGYRSRESFAGRRVIVVGGGNSGAQIAADLAPVTDVA